MTVTQISSAPKREGAARLKPPPNRNLKNTDFANAMILNALRDLHFSRNQPMTSASEFYNQDI